MAATWIFGLTMTMVRPDLWHQPWFHAKFGLVLLMTIVGWIINHLPIEAAIAVLVLIPVVIVLPLFLPHLQRLLIKPVTKQEIFQLG